MESNPSGNHNYRESRQSIEGLLELFDDKEFLTEAALNFFGLARYSEEKGYETLEKVLTDDELEKFKVFCKHVCKRIINAHSEKNNGAIKVYEKLNPNIRDLSDMHTSDRYQLFNMMFHDLSHSVGKITRGDRKTSSDPVQPFLRSKDGEINNREIIEDELRGFIYGSLFYPSPLRGNRPLLHLSASQDFEEFKTNFISKTIKAALSDNYRSLLEQAQESDDFEGLLRLETEAQQIGEEIITNPPEDVLQSLAYIWEHRGNERVLVDLFFIQTNEYIVQLQKRKNYTVLTK
jgi:hypothetical protein